MICPIRFSYRRNLQILEILCYNIGWIIITMSVEKKIPRIEIKIASPERIRELSVGEVKKYETYDSNRTSISDGLFDYKIFCNQKICPNVNKLNCFTNLNTNNSCAGCKKDNCRGCENQKLHDLFKQYQKEANACCKKCLTKKNKCSYECMGHIELAAPVVHIWFKDTICKILGFTKKEFKGILEFQNYIEESTVEFVLDKKKCISNEEKEVYISEREKKHKSCHLISGANAIRLLLSSLDEYYEAEIEHLKERIKESKGETKKTLESRLELIEGIHNSGNKFTWLVLDVLPVVPPSIRPEVKTGSSDKDFSKDDLNNLYALVISRNERIKNLDKMSAPKVMIENEICLLQKAVDALFDNAKCKGYQKRVYKGENFLTEGRVYKSLTDRISKKEGLFRQNLLGKRVDFSGRCVIVTGPELQLWQCGLPYDMALELFRFQIIHEFAVQILDKLDQIIYGCDINVFRSIILKNFEKNISIETWLTVKDSIIKVLKKAKKDEEKNNIRQTIRVSELEGKDAIDEIIKAVREELTHDNLAEILYKIGLINYRTYGSLKSKLKNAKKYELKTIVESLNVSIITGKLWKDFAFKENLSLFKQFVDKHLNANEKIKKISNTDEEFFERLLEKILSSLGNIWKLPTSNGEFEVFYKEKFKGKIIYKIEAQEESLFKDLLFKIISEIKESGLYLYGAVEKVIKDYPIILNRQPSLHRLNIQAFEPVIVEEKAIKLHPLLCKSFGADFDGDQMAVHIPIGKEAIKECKELLLSTKNMFKPGDGKPIFVPSQDMVIGLYLLSAINTDEKCADYTDSYEDDIYEKIQKDLKCKEIELNSSITIYVPKNSFDLALLKCEDEKKEERYVKDRNQVFKKGDLITTTAGLYILNSSLPDEVPYINRQLDADTIKKLIDAVYELTSPEVTIELHDILKKLGFRYATRFGASISMDEINISEKIKGKKDENNEVIKPDEKWKNLKDEIENLANSKANGLITKYEYNKDIEKLFIKNNKSLEDKMKALLESKRTDPGVFDMADSGARGKWNQVSQIALMKGLVKNSRGDVNLILSNFNEGLSPHEYFISTAGTRRDLFDGKFSTGDAGYITRRLVYAAQNVVIEKEDCGCGIPDEKRSILTCKCETGICQKCYGNDLSFGRNKKNLVEIGTPVGIIAAQSLGEPTSQLVLDSKHKYGVSSVEEKQNEKINQIISECLGKVEIYALENNDETKKADLKVLLDENNALVFNEKYSNLCPKVRVYNGEETLKIYDIPYGYVLLVRNGEEIKESTVIAENPKTVEVLTKIERLLENWTTDCAVVSDVSGKIEKIELAPKNSKNKDYYDFVIEQEIQTKVGKKYRIERPYSIPVSEKLFVEDGDKVISITAKSDGKVKKIEYEKYKKIAIVDENNIKELLIPATEEICVKKGQKIKSEEQLCDSTKEYKAGLSGKIKSIDDIEKVVVTIETKEGNKEVYDIPKLASTKVKVKENDEVNAGNLLLYSSLVEETLVTAKSTGTVKIEYEKYKKITIVDEAGLRATGDYDRPVKDEKHIKEMLIPDTEEICVKKGQKIKFGEQLCESSENYKAGLSGIIDSIEEIKKIKAFSIVDDGGNESKYDIKEFSNSILKVKDGDKVKVGDLLCYPSTDYPTKAMLHIPKDKNEVFGTVKFLKVTEKSENWNIIVKDKEKEHKFIVPRSSQLCVKAGDNVEKGTPLNKGNISYNDRLLFESKLEVQKQLVEELHNLIKNVDKKHIEVIVRQMFKDVNDDGKRNITGSIKGITKLGLESDSFLVASAFQRTSTGLVNAALKGKNEKFTGIIENQMIGNLIPAGKGFKESEQNKNDK